MKVTLTVLCENNVESVRPHGLLGEHGFSCHLVTPHGNFLFDTGNGLTLLHNADKLGINLPNLSGIILSHGHYDHTGGLKQLLEKTGPITLYTHPDFFTPRFSTLGNNKRDIGVPYDREELEALGAKFDFSREAREIVPEMILSGEIPRITPVEKGDPQLMINCPEHGQIQDPIYDDQSLYIKTSEGLLVLLGCAHSGLINILDHAGKTTKEKKIYMVVGGTHLKFCSEEQLLATVQRLAELNVKRIGASHCTGLRGAHILAESFGERFFAASVGVTINV